MPGTGLPSTPALYENLVEFSPDALLVVDATGRIRLTNRSTESLFGYASQELLGAPVEQLVPERLRQTHALHRAGFAGNPHTREMGATVTDLLALRKDGSEFPVEIRLSPVDIDGSTFVVAAARDVTDRRHVLRFLQAAQQEADRANAAKSRFLATASHDLRQPLQSLQLLNATLRGQVTDPASRQLLERQHDALASMSQLLNSLLDISRLEAGTICPDLGNVAVAEIFRTLQQEFEALARARNLTLTVAGSPHYIRTDRTLLLQLLQNLLANAIKYTESGSVRLCSYPEADRLVIEVADTGIGIAAEQLGLIFEEYYQVNRIQRQGVGLGLSIVKRVAALLGLSIDVQSEPGRGTRFRVSVPPSRISTVTPVNADPAGDRQPPPHAAGAVILLVEDDDAVRAATAFYLRTVGHRPIAVPGIAAAELALKEAERPPELIISDYHLGPLEDGIQAIQRLRALACASLPALLLSGDTSSAVRQLAASNDCRILSKPVDVDAMVNVISELLAAAASGRQTRA